MSSGIEVNREQLAAFLGCHPKAIATKVRHGLPVVQMGSRGKPWIFDLVAVRAWEIGQLEADAAKGREPDPGDRLRAVQAERAELELAEFRAQLVRIDDVVAVVEPLLADLRRHLDAVPAACAHEVAGGSVAVAERAISSAISDALEEIVERWGEHGLGDKRGRANGASPARASRRAAS
ncbi:MAG: terminase small subunit [Myxococcales bacterium]|nr:terminase small subunit [Myxococcales bacterium]